MIKIVQTIKLTIMVENKNKSGDKSKTEKMIFKSANKKKEYYRDCLKREFYRFKAELIVAFEMGFITPKQAKKLSNVTYTETLEIEEPAVAPVVESTTEPAPQPEVKEEPVVEEKVEEKVEKKKVSQQMI